MSNWNQTARPDASIVPVEGATSTQSASPFGTNNEQLPERLQSALRRIVQQFGTESESTRRQEIRRIKQAHQFWRGLQYLWWSERDQNWHLPFEQKLTDGSSIEDLPRYEFVTNIYQGSASRSSACFRRTCRASAFSPHRRRRKKMCPPRKPPRKLRSSSNATIESEI